MKKQAKQVEKLKNTQAQYPFWRGVLAAAAGFAAGLAVVVVLARAADERPRTDAPSPGMSREATRRAEENFLAARVVEVLEPLVGAGRARAEVRLDMDYDTVTTSEELFAPDGQVLRSYVARENFASEAEYEINKYRRQVVQNGGRLKKMSVLVLVDCIPDGRVCRGLSSVERSRLAELVMPVTGFDARRGDVLQIENVRFYDEPGFGLFRLFEFLLLAAFLGALIVLWRKLPGRSVPSSSAETASTAKIGKDVWQRLRAADADALAGWLAGECPAAAAYALSRLDADKAAAALEKMPLSYAAETAAAMATETAVSPAAAKSVEDSLQRYFAADGVMKKSGSVLEKLSPGRRRELLSAMEKEDAALAERLRQKMFLFEDFASVDDAAIRRLFDEVEAERLAVALRGASEPLKQRFFADMPVAAAEYVKKEMKSLGPVKLREVEAAQDEIVALAEKLAAKGKIRLSVGKGGRD